MDPFGRPLPVIFSFGPLGSYVSLIVNSSTAAAEVSVGFPLVWIVCGRRRRATGLFLDPRTQERERGRRGLGFLKQGDPVDTGHGCKLRGQENERAGSKNSGAAT